MAKWAVPWYQVYQVQSWAVFLLSCWPTIQKRAVSGSKAAVPGSLLRMGCQYRVNSTLQLMRVSSFDCSMICPALVWCITEQSRIMVEMRAAIAVKTREWRNDANQSWVRISLRGNVGYTSCHAGAATSRWGAWYFARGLEVYAAARTPCLQGYVWQYLPAYGDTCGRTGT